MLKLVSNSALELSLHRQFLYLNLLVLISH